MSPARARGTRTAPFVPDEPCLLAHCKRVAWFARLLSERLEVAPDKQRDIEDAAICHHALPLMLSPEALQRLEDDLQLSFPPAGTSETESLNDLRAIIRADFGDSPEGRDLTIQSQILEACNCLDESVEFAPFEGLSISAALDSFGLSGEPVFFRLLGLGLHHNPVRFDGREALGRITRLPVLPKAVRRLLALDKETAGVTDLEAIVKSDQALAAGLISRANSPLFGRMSETRNIRDAIVYLGVPAACSALLAASFQTLFASAALTEVWKHASAVAGLARRIALAAGGVDPDEAYLAGLVHDIGRLVIEKFPQASRALEMELIENGFPAVYAEAIAYRADHAELGAELLRNWHFPASLVEAVQYHHRPEATSSRMAALLYLAEILSETSDQVDFEDLPSILRRGKAAQCVGLTMDRFCEMENDRQFEQKAG